MHPATRTVWIATAVDAVVLFLLGWDKYATYRGGSDLGLFAQSVASVFHGFGNAMEAGNHFVVHFSPILYLCAPALLLTHSALALVAIQALAGALVAPPLYALLRKRAGESLARTVALGALLYPPLVGVAFADFHENGFVPALTVALAYAADARRFRLATVFACALLATKEDQALVLAWCAVAGSIYFARRRERAGAAWCGGLCVASLAVFVAFYAVVRPLAGAHGGWTPLRFYAWSHAGTGVGGDALHAIVARVSYAFEALLPLVFLPLRSAALLLAVPGAVELLASREPITYTMGQHYAAVWIGATLVAYALALARIARERPERARRLARASAALSLLILVIASPTHWARTLAWPSAHDRALDRTLAALPRDAAIGTQEEIYAHLGFDPNATLGIASRPPLVLLDTTHGTSFYVMRDAPRIRARIAAGAATVLPSAPGLLLVRERSEGAVSAAGKTR